MKAPSVSIRLTQAVREYLTELIIENKLGPGEPLPPETELARELSVARSSVREAVKGLQALGVLEARQGEGLYVREQNLDPVLEALTYQLRWDSSLLSDLVQIRTWLETAAIGDIVERISQHRLQQLDDTLEVWTEKVKEGEAYAEQDRQFHRLLHETLNNGTLVKLLDVFWVAFENVGIDAIRQDLDPVKTLRDHRGILEALRSRDGVLAQQRLRESFLDIQTRIDQAQAHE